MDCPKCGAGNNDDAAFCTLCYTKFDVRQPAAADAVETAAQPIAPVEGVAGPKRAAGHGLGGKTAAPIGHARPATAVDFSDPAVRAGLLGEKPGLLFTPRANDAGGSNVEVALEAGIEIVQEAAPLLEGLADILGGLSSD